MGFGRLYPYDSAAPEGIRAADRAKDKEMTVLNDLPEITSAEQFDREVIGETEMPVVVTFTAEWCGDCQQIAPHVAQWAEEYAGRMKFVWVEDARRDLEEKYHVHMIPDVIVFFGGKLISRWVNVSDGDAYRKTFDRILGVTEL